MDLKISSYRFAKEILQHPKYSFIYNEIREICSKCPLPVYEGKSTVQTSKDVVQQIMNTYFRQAFTNSSWESEPFATPDDNEDGLRGDFKKDFQLLSDEDNVDDDDNVLVQTEVEFGNSASSYRNYFKFQLSYSYDLADIGLLILPSYDLSKRIDSGVATYEKALREIPSAKLSITIPILIIGLDYKNTREWNVKEEATNLLIRRNIPDVMTILNTLETIYNNIKFADSDDIWNSIQELKRSEKITISQIEDIIERMQTFYNPEPKVFNKINRKIRKLKLDIVKGSKKIYKNHEHSILVNSYIENEG